MHLDIPIIDKKDDILHFSKVAESISKRIIDYKQKDSLIISIEGEWGSGKTSFANLMKGELNDKVTLIHFNPWMVNGFEELVRYFFSELLKEICFDNFEAKLKEEILKDFKSFLSIITPNAIKFKTPVFEVGYNLKETIFSEDEESLYNLKNKLNGYLEKLDKKIVIIIDDIDRLTDKETETFFRLVKGIADFNNIVYVLLYDKEIVANSLKKFKNEKGEKYLDKIVQYSLSLPKAHNNILREELISDLNKLIDEIKKDGKEYIFDENRWGIVISCIDKYIKNLRDVKKIISIMSFEYPLICEDVNFIDFFVISLIKVQNAELYKIIKDNPNNFFGNKTLEEQEKANKRILESFDKKFDEYKEILKSIFPAFYEYGLQLGYVHKNKYMASNEYFENYFSFSVSTNSISHKEYADILPLMFSLKYEEFKEKILNFDRNRKSKELIYMFTQRDLKNISYENDILILGISNILIVAKNVKEGVYDKSLGFLDFPGPEYIFCHCAFKLLKKANNTGDIILKLFENEQIPLIYKVDLLEDIEKSLKDYNEPIVIEENKLTTYKERIIKSLSSLSFTDLIKVYRGKGLIYKMEVLNLPLEDLYKEINEFTFNSNENFFITLEFFKYWQQSSSINLWLIDKEHFGKIIDIERVEKYINNLNKNELSVENLDLVKIWNTPWRD